jgi:PBP1b-binding outer membrane lipoprotein LpoB
MSKKIITALMIIAALVFTGCSDGSSGQTDMTNHTSEELLV